MQPRIHRRELLAAAAAGAVLSGVNASFGIQAANAQADAQADAQATAQADTKKAGNTSPLFTTRPGPRVSRGRRRRRRSIAR